MAWRDLNTRVDLFLAIFESLAFPGLSNSDSSLLPCGWKGSPTVWQEERWGGADVTKYPELLQFFFFHARLLWARRIEYKRAGEFGWPCADFSFQAKEEKEIAYCI